MNADLNVLWNTEFLSSTYTPKYPCINSNGPISQPLQKLLDELNDDIIQSGTKKLTKTFLIQLSIYIIIYVKQKYGLTYDEIYEFIISADPEVITYSNFSAILKSALRFGAQKGIFLLHYLLTLEDGSSVIITPSNFVQYKSFLNQSSNVQFLYCVNSYMQFSNPSNEKFLPCLCNLYQS